jgi:choline-sulfatase
MADRPHVLFLVVDSARKDRLSAYDHHRETTPTLDAFADDATLYENAFTPAPWTLPSHWSLFTGQFPSEHGVTNGFTDQGLYRPDDVETVTQLLSRDGYRTAAFSNNPWVGQLSGLDRGFDKFVEWDLEISRSDGHGARTRDELLSRLHWFLGRAANQPQVVLKRRFFTSNLVDRAQRWLSDVATGGAPTFTFLNLMEAHSPYYPPRSAFKALDLTPPTPIESRTLNLSLLAYVMGKTDLSREQQRRVYEFYDASLRFQDEQVGELLSTLKRAGVYDDTLIVVCADHGKTLGEYDRDGVPPHYLRDINVNVPLLVKPPGGTGPGRVEEPYELTRLFDVLRAGHPTDAHLRSEKGDALVEDHIPHTGREMTAVTRWRALVDTESKYVCSEDGDEFHLWRGDTEGQRPVDDYGVYQDRMAERLSALDVREAVAQRGDEAIGGAVEGQLEDLGYL